MFCKFDTTWLIEGVGECFCATAQIHRKGIMHLRGEGATRISGKGFTQGDGKGEIKDHLYYSTKTILGLKGTMMPPNYSSVWVMRYV